MRLSPHVPSIMAAWIATLAVSAKRKEISLVFIFIAELTDLTLQSYEKKSTFANDERRFLQKEGKIMKNYTKMMIFQLDRCAIHENPEKLGRRL